MPVAATKGDLCSKKGKTRLRLMAKSTLISIIVPVFNEAEGLPTFYKVLNKELNKLPYTFEIIFVDDGSLDGSLNILEELAAEDPRIHVIEFARNFGKELATSAGLHAAHGDAALMIDADLQYPVKLIRKFIEMWNEGADVVIGVRDGNRHDTYFKRLASRTFYALMSAMTEVEITPHATDFRIVDRVVIDHFNRFTERGRMTRGLIDWLGFKRQFIHFEADPRRFGTASYSIVKLVKLAFNSFINNSLLPLRLAGYLGAIIILFSTPLGLFIFIEKYVTNNSLGIVFSGSVILMVILLFLVGIILVSLGLIAMYIANIHIEVVGRPMYVVRSEFAKFKHRRPLRLAPTEPTPRKRTRLAPAIASRARPTSKNKK